MAYDIEKFWSSVAREVSARGDSNFLATDETPYTTYKRECFVQQWLLKMPVTGKVVFELGCGPGGNLFELASLHPKHLLAADISSEMVELARRNVSYSSEIFHVADGNLPLGDRQVDISFTATVLMHNKTGVADVIRELCRVTSEEIFVFEEAGRYREMPYNIRRPVKFYEEQFHEHGFRMKESDVLSTAVSRLVCGSLDRLFYRGRRGKGKPINPVSRGLQSVAVKVLHPIDRAVGAHQGLTRMVFVRERGSS